MSGVGGRSYLCGALDLDEERLNRLPELVGGRARENPPPDTQRKEFSVTPYSCFDWPGTSRDLLASICLHGLLVDVPKDTLYPAGMAQLAKSPHFDLPNAFPSHPITVGDLFQRPLVAVMEPVTKPDDIFFPIIERR